MSQTARRILPSSEFRRTYLKNLVRQMQIHSGVSAAKAKEALGLTIALLEAKVAAGESIDLGFMNLKVASTKPGAFVAPGTSGTKAETTYMIGESKRWWPVIRKSWLRKIKPKWSRY